MTDHRKEPAEDDGSSSSFDSVSDWIDRAKQGDEEAIAQLWERYFDQLVHEARKRLYDLRRPTEDEEDAALSAFNSFCRAAKAGKFPKLSDRDGLWRLLMQIVIWKSHDLRRRVQRRPAVGESAFDVDRQGTALTPEDVAITTDTYLHLCELLGDDELRQIVAWRLEQRPRKEMAQDPGRSVAYVDLRLQLIRKKWTRELERLKTECQD